MEIIITVVKGPDQGKQFSFTEYQKITIGRATQNFISFEKDAKLSRFHGIMEILPPNNIYIQDLNSANGILLGVSKNNTVNFQKIANANIQNGNYLKMGENIFQIKWENESIREKSCDKCGKSIKQEDYAQGLAYVDQGKDLCIQCMKDKEYKAEKKIGNFEVLEKLGEGGMGVVYKVQHEKIGRAHV